MKKFVTPQEAFAPVLARHYTQLFKSDPEYAYSASKTTPEELARRMTIALNAGTGNKDGTGIKLTCKELGIKYTYTGIKEYFAQPCVEIEVAG